MGSWAALPRDQQRFSNIRADPPLVKTNAEAHPERKQPLPKLFSYSSGQRRINAVRWASPTWGICDGFNTRSSAIAGGCFLICKPRQLGQTVRKAHHPYRRAALVQGTSHRPSQQQITTMSVERRVATDRRSGKDRRETEAGPPTNFERRRNVEARQPELTELHLSEDELQALGFAPGKSDSKKP